MNTKIDKAWQERYIINHDFIEGVGNLHNDRAEKTHNHCSNKKPRGQCFPAPLYFGKSWFIYSMVITTVILLISQAFYVPKYYAGLIEDRDSDFSTFKPNKEWFEGIKFPIYKAPSFNSLSATIKRTYIQALNLALFYLAQDILEKLKKSEIRFFLESARQESNSQMSREAHVNPQAGEVVFFARSNPLPFHFHNFERVFRNEMFHAMSIASNLEKQPKLSLLSAPLLNSKGHVDQTLVSRLLTIEKKFNERVSAFEALLHIHFWRHTKIVTDKIKEALEIFREYKPSTYTWNLSKKYHNQLVNEDHITTPDKSQAFVRAGTLPDGSLLQFDLYIENIKSSHDRKYIEYCYAPHNATYKQKALAWIRDVRLIDAAQKIFPEYNNNNDLAKLEERFSSYAAFPPRILQYFFPEFCRYTSTYFEVENYCSIPNP